MTDRNASLSSPKYRRLVLRWERLPAFDDELGTPLACVSELHYPETDVDTVGTPLQLARGGCLSTWQGGRL